MDEGRSMHEKESLLIYIGLIKANFILKVLVHSYFFTIKHPSVLN